GSDRQVYGLAGAADLKHLRSEVSLGAEAVKLATGTAPRWYRGATGEYDPEALKEIEKMGYKVAGFSINADSGATLSQRQVVARLKKVRSGDIIILILTSRNRKQARAWQKACSCCSIGVSILSGSTTP